MNINNIGNIFDWDILLSKAAVQENSNIVYNSQDHNIILIDNEELNKNQNKYSNLTIKQIIELTKESIEKKPDKKESIINHVNLILERDKSQNKSLKQFKKFIKSLDLKSDITALKYKDIPQTAPEKELFNFALKGRRKEETKRLAEAHEGLIPQSAALSRYTHAVDLLHKLSIDPNFMGLDLDTDFEDLQRICLQRKNFLSYQEQIGRLLLGSKELIGINKQERDQLLSAIQDNIDLLIAPEVSDKITVLSDGTRSFALPGAIRHKGETGHSITYEFQAKKNKAGEFEFFFVINNRGDKCDDPDIHGDLKYEYKGRTFSRTTVPIRVKSIETIKDKEFLKKLIEYQTGFEAPYNQARDELYAVFKGLITSGNGEIVKSEQEALLENLLEDNKHPFADQKILHEQILSLIEQDPTWNSRQLYGTCVESNYTATEKKMASKKILQTLKTFTTTEIIRKIAYDVLDIKQQAKKEMKKWEKVENLSKTHVFSIQQRPLINPDHVKKEREKNVQEMNDRFTKGIAVLEKVPALNDLMVQFKISKSSSKLTEGLIQIVMKLKSLNDFETIVKLVEYLPNYHAPTLLKIIADVYSNQSPEKAFELKKKALSLIPNMIDMDAAEKLLMDICKDSKHLEVYADIVHQFSDLKLKTWFLLLTSTELTKISPKKTFQMLMELSKEQKISIIDKLLLFGSWRDNTAEAMEFLIECNDVEIQKTYTHHLNFIKHPIEAVAFAKRLSQDLVKEKDRIFIEIASQRIYFDSKDALSIAEQVNDENLLFKFLEQFAYQFSDQVLALVPKIASEDFKEQVLSKVASSLIDKNRIKEGIDLINQIKKTDRISRLIEQLIPKDPVEARLLTKKLNLDDEHWRLKEHLTASIAESFVSHHQPDAALGLLEELNFSNKKKILENIILSGNLEKALIPTEKLNSQKNYLEPSIQYRIVQYYLQKNNFDEAIKNMGFVKDASLIMSFLLEIPFYTSEEMTSKIQQLIHEKKELLRFHFDQPSIQKLVKKMGEKIHYFVDEFIQFPNSFLKYHFIHDNVISLMEKFPDKLLQMIAGLPNDHKTQVLDQLVQKHSWEYSTIESLNFLIKCPDLEIQKKLIPPIKFSSTDLALEFAHKLPDTLIPEKEQILLSVVKDYQQQGNIPKMLEVVAQIKNQYILRKFILRVEPEQAILLSKLLTNEYEKDIVYQKISEKFMAEKQFNELFELSKNINNRNLLSKITDYFVLQNRPHEAFEIAKSNYEYERMTDTYFKIAQAFISKGQPEKILKVSSLITNINHLQELLKELIALNHLDTAIAFNDRFERGNIFFTFKIAKGYLEGNNIEKAIQTMSTVNNKQVLYEFLLDERLYVDKTHKNNLIELAKILPQQQKEIIGDLIDPGNVRVAAVERVPVDPIEEAKLWINIYNSLVIPLGFQEFEDPFAAFDFGEPFQEVKKDEFIFPPLPIRTVIESDDPQVLLSDAALAKSILEEHGKDVQSLKLSGKGLTQLPKDLAKFFPNVTTIDLSDNNFSTFPEELTDFSKLGYLSLSNNNISFLSENIQKLKNLNILNLSNNPQLANLPRSFNLKDLENLSINFCNFFDVPRQIRSLNKLKYLDISMNGNLTELPIWLKELPQLNVNAINQEHLFF